MAGTLGFSTPQMHANPSYEALVLKCDQIKEERENLRRNLACIYKQLKVMTDIITQEYNTVRRERQFLEVAAEQDTHESTSLRKVVLDHIEVLEQTEETYEELLGIEDEDARRQLYAIKMD